MFQAAIKLLYCSIFNYSYFGKQPQWLILALSLSLKSYTVVAQTPPKIAIDRQKMTRTITARGVSGGNTPLGEIARTKNTATGHCNGYGRIQPNHSLELTSSFDFLRLEVESSADTTILVRGPGGVWCNDDASTTNPLIEGQWQSGIYRIWVGSYQADTENDYQIKITGR